MISGAGNDNLVSATALGEAVEEIRERLNVTTEILEENVEKRKAKCEAKIMAKLEAGKKLTYKEMCYLKENNPILYAHAVRVQIKRESVEEQLKHAKSKEEVLQIQGDALLSIGKEDPARKYMIAAVMETIDAFKKTQDYKRLPPKEEKNENKEKINEIRNDEDKDSQDDCDMDLTYDISEGSYQIAYKAGSGTREMNFIAYS